MESSRQELQETFLLGAGVKPREYQIEAVSQLLHQVGSLEHALIQHAPGSGKTETALLFIYECLRRGLFERAIVVNFAKDLEEQFRQRAECFLNNLEGGGGHESQIPIHSLCKSSDTASMMQRTGMIFTLLQKFSARCTAHVDSANLNVSADARTLIVVDEAHRGIPDDGVWIKNIERAVPGRKLRILLTATPKHDTLNMYGTRDGVFLRPFHTYTVKNAISSRTTLSALDHYSSAVPTVIVDGTRLCDTDNCLLSDYLERLHERRNDEDLRVKWAATILNRMPPMWQAMATMVEKGHQPKHLVVLESMLEVLLMKRELERQVVAKKIRNAFRKPLTVRCFFSGKVTSSSDSVTDTQENGCGDKQALEEADVIVVCQKYTTGWDEWRLIAVFLCRRIGCPEFLMQLLGRGSRVRPGSGKKMPYVVDFMNDPDRVFMAASLFYEESRKYDNDGGELQIVEDRIQNIVGTHWSNLQLFANKLRMSEQAMLRANILRRFQVCAKANEATSLDAADLKNLLRELNLAMKDALWGGSESLAKRAVHHAIDQATHHNEIKPASGQSGRVAVATTLTQVMRPLRRLCTRALAHSSKSGAKRRCGYSDSDGDEKAQKRPRQSATPEQLLSSAVDRIASKFTAHIGKVQPSEHMLDRRGALIHDFTFLTFKLRSFNNAEHAAQVEGALSKLHEQLNCSHRMRVEPWLKEERRKQFVDFVAAVDVVDHEFMSCDPKRYAKLAGLASDKFQRFSSKLGGDAGSEWLEKFGQQLDVYIQATVKRSPHAELVKTIEKREHELLVAFELELVSLRRHGLDALALGMLGMVELHKTWKDFDSFLLTYQRTVSADILVEAKQVFHWRLLDKLDSRSHVETPDLLRLSALGA